MHAQHAHHHGGPRRGEHRFERRIALDRQVKVVVGREGVRANPVEQGARMLRSTHAEKPRRGVARIERRDPDRAGGVFRADQEAPFQRPLPSDLPSEQGEGVLEPGVVRRREPARDDPVGAAIRSTSVQAISIKTDANATRMPHRS